MQHIEFIKKQKTHRALIDRVIERACETHDWLEKGFQMPALRLAMLQAAEKLVSKEGQLVRQA